MALKPVQAARIFMRAAACSAALVAGVAAAAPAHEHGAARLDVVLDGSTLTLSLESPLANLVGSERAPKNNKERAALQQMEERLRDGDALFRPDATAACRLKDVSVAHPFQAGKKRAGAHADADASWTFTCKSGDLKQIEVQLFDVFPQLRRLRVQTATPAGQGAASLDKTNRSLVLPRPPGGS